MESAKVYGPNGSNSRCSVYSWDNNEDRWVYYPRLSKRMVVTAMKIAETDSVEEEMCIEICQVAMHNVHFHSSAEGEGRNEEDILCLLS